jgi:hypothetical protein
MPLLLRRNEKIYVFANFILLYINVFVTFSLIYLLLDILQLGPLINRFSINDPKILLSEKLLNSLHLSAKTLFSDSYSYVIPFGWSKVVAFIEGTVGFILPAFIMLRFLSLENVKNVRLERRKPSISKLLFRSFFVTIGALFVSLALEIFLVPNKIIDGGIVGISIMMSFLTGLKLELFILILNLPFLYLGYKKIGKNFVITTLFGICMLSLGTLFLYNVPIPTDNPLLASLFGGICLGIGVGLVIRHGGSLDGTEILGILLNKRTPFSVGTIVMFLNVFIFSTAGFVFGWDKAFYSLIAYYIASVMIDLTIKEFHA